MNNMTKQADVLVGVLLLIIKYNNLYTDFNCNGPQMQLGLKRYPGFRSMLNITYRFQSRDYNNYSSFDVNNHNGSIEYIHFSRSQTTGSVQVGFNYRFYPLIA